MIPQRTSCTHGKLPNCTLEAENSAQIRRGPSIYRWLNKKMNPTIAFNIFNIAGKIQNKFQMKQISFKKVVRDFGQFVCADKNRILMVT
jgi:hypothetical protein